MSPELAAFLIYAGIAVIAFLFLSGARHMGERNDGLLPPPAQRL